jgi:hypothetical protein
MSIILNMTKFKLDAAVEILSRTPETIAAMIGGLSDEWTRGGEDQKNWGPFDVLGHLIHAEETDWMPRAEIILTEGEDRPFTPFDRFAQFEASKGKTLEDLLGTFSTLRAKNLQKLASWNLTDEQLELKGMHPELGVVTLRQLIATWTVHDLNHIKQIAAVLAGKYSIEVGPWKAYLSILQ